MEDLSRKPAKICNNRFLLKLTKDKLKAVLQLVSEEESFENVPFDEIVKEVQNLGGMFWFCPQASSGKGGENRYRQRQTGSSW
jgi:hypothetical protein